VRTIYKYPLRLVDHQKIMMPLYAQVLSIQLQGSEIQLWALVETDNELVEWRFWLFGTGTFEACLADGLHYHATVQCGSFVWHVFEEPRCACYPPCIPWHVEKRRAA
jgi:hypothetical protein